MAGKSSGVRIGIASDFNPRGFAAAESRAASLERIARKSSDSIGGGFIRAGDKLQSVGYRMQSVGSTLTRSVTLPLIAVGAAGVAAFMKVEDAEADVIRRTGATGVAADTLRQTFRDVANNTAADISTIPPVLATVTSRLGLTGTAASTVTRKFLALAKVSGDDATEATQELTKAMKDWSIGAKEAPSFMDKMAVASQKSGVSVTTLANDLYTFGSPLRALGFGMDQTIALLANFERSGVRTDLVMGSLRIGLGKLAAAGEKDLPGAMAKSIQAIKNAKNPTDATRMAFELFGRRAGADMAAAIREGRFSVDDLLKALGGSQGALDRTGNAAGTLGKQWGIARNRMMLAAAAVGDVLAPYLAKAAKYVQDMAQRFQELDPGVKKAIVAVGGLVAVGGPLIAMFGSLASGIGAIMSLIAGGGTIAGVFGAMSTGMTATAGAAGAAAGATGGLGGILAGVGAAAGPAIAVIAAVAGAGYLLYKNWDQVSAQLGRLQAAFTPAFEQIKTAVTGAIGGIMPTLQKLSAEVGPTFKAIADYIIIAWRVVGPVVMPIVTGLVQGIGGVLNTLLNVVRAVMAVLRGDWSGAWTAIKDAAGSLVGAVVSVVGGLFNGLGVILGAIWGGIKAAASAVWGAITGAIGVAVGAVVGVVQGAWTAVSGATSAAWSAITGAVGAALSWLYNHNYYVQAMVDGIHNMWTSLVGWTSGAWNSVKSAVSGAIGAVRSAVTSGVNAAASAVSAAWNAVKSATTSIWNSVVSVIGGFVGKVGSKAKEIANAVSNPIKNLIGQAYSWGSNLLGQFIDGIKSKVGQISEALRGAAQKIAAFLGFHSPTEEGPGRDADKWAPNLVSMYAAGIVGSLPTLERAVAAMASALNPGGGQFTPAFAGYGGSGYSSGGYASRQITIMPGAVQIVFQGGISASIEDVDSTVNGALAQLADELGRN